jgi:hypothetical protein
MLSQYTGKLTKTNLGGLMVMTLMTPKDHITFTAYAIALSAFKTVLAINQCLFRDNF